MDIASQLAAKTAAHQYDFDSSGIDFSNPNYKDQANAAAAAASNRNNPTNNPDVARYLASPEFKAFQQENAGGIGTMDIYESPYFGGFSSGSFGRGQDAHYENWLKNNPGTTNTGGNTNVQVGNPVGGTGSNTGGIADINVGGTNTGGTNMGGTTDVNVGETGGTTTGGTTTTTTLDPSQSTLSPNFAQYVYNMMRRGEQAAMQPYTFYTGQRFAGTSPLEQQAFSGLGSLQTPWQYGAGSGMLYQTGLGSFTRPGTSQAFMSPYIQDVVDVEKREAQRQADIARTQRGAQAVKAGAFGGSRQAIMEAEAGRNLAQQMGDIQTRGLQSAYDRATQQYNAERDAQMRAAMGLGSLGQQQFGSQLQGLQGLLSAGGTQRQIAQQPLDFGYQQFQESLQYPYKQATFMKSLLEGMPVGAAPYRAATDSDSLFGSALQGGLSGLALYNMFNKN